MQEVFIIGSKGIPANYGGFETFVDQLVSRQMDQRLHYHVACMDHETKEMEYKNARLFHVKVPNIGPAKAVYYDVAALKQVIQFIKKQKIEHAIVYILACRIGPFIGHYKKQLKKLGAQLYINPDGHEWKRAKWNFLIRKYWKLSEKLMVKYADLLICDSVNIEDYIKNDYAAYQPKTTFLAYGADTSLSTLKDEDEKLTAWYQEKGLQKKEYYLVVGRFVPENNYETMIREFMASSSQKDFVLITNVEKNKFFEDLKNQTQFDQDPRIKFVGTVYDKELIKKIRENAFAYFHGHEVGGTNPSLLEALASTDLNLLLNVGFNEEVAKDGALYFTKESGNLAKLIEKTEQLSKQEMMQLVQKAKKRIHDNYSWESIVTQYEALFLKKDRRKKILLVSNMYPSKKYPHYGVFVQNTEQLLRTNGHYIKPIVLKKSDHKMVKLVRYISFYMKIVRNGFFHSYDVVYAHYASHTALPLLLLKTLKPNLPLVMNVHGNDLVPEDEHDEKYAKLVTKILKKSTHIIVPSTYFKEIIMDQIGIVSSKITVYPSGGVNTTLFKKIPSDEAKRFMDLDPSKRYVGYVARLEKRKGWDILLQAIALGKEQWPTDLRFLFVGGGSEEPLFHEMIHELKIESYIIHIPFLPQSQLPYAYNSCTIFCFPTYRKSESLGLVGLEAMATETIVLASKMAGPTCYIVDHENGFFFEPQNAESLFEKLQFILNLKEEQKEQIQIGARFRALQYDAELTKELLLELFRS